MTKAEFEKERDELSFKNVHHEAYQAGYTACLSSDVVKNMEAALESAIFRLPDCTVREEAALALADLASCRGNDE